MLTTGTATEVAAGAHFLQIGSLAVEDVAAEIPFQMHAEFLLGQE